MNKNWGFVFSLLIVVILFSFVSAADSLQQTSQQIDNLSNQINSGAQQIDNVINNPTQTKEQLRKEFLTKAWFGDSGIIGKNVYIGPIYLWYMGISPYTNPIFEYTVGMAPALSWIFFLALFISITLIEYFYRFYEVLRDSSTLSGNASIVVSLAFFLVLILLQFFAKLSISFANAIISMVSVLTEWWMQLIALMLIFVALFFAAKYSKQLEFLARYIRTKRKQMADEERRARGEAATRKLEVYGEELGKAFK